MALERPFDLPHRCLELLDYGVISVVPWLPMPSPPHSEASLRRLADKVHIVRIGIELDTANGAGACVRETLERPGAGEGAFRFYGTSTYNVEDGIARGQKQ